MKLPSYKGVPAGLSLGMLLPVVLIGGVLAFMPRSKPPVVPDVSFAGAKEECPSSENEYLGVVLGITENGGAWFDAYMTELSDRGCYDSIDGINAVATKMIALFEQMEE